MNDQWLEKKLCEAEHQNTKFTFKFQGTVNWMRAIALLCELPEFKQELKSKYKDISASKDIGLPDQVYALSHILMGIHFLAALKEMSTQKKEKIAAALVRSAIVSWYYGIYHASKAMLVMQDGTRCEAHNKIANAWDRQLCQSDLIIPPFNYRVSSLIDKDAKKEISVFGSPKEYSSRLPNDKSSAENCCCACLNGSVRWYKEREIVKIAKDNNFKNFYAKNAKKVRDNRLRTCVCGFLHQAIRYRGKANYRDILFLSYGDADKRYVSLIHDLEVVLVAFISMAIAFCSKKINKQNWSSFVDDIVKNSYLSQRLEELLRRQGEN